LVGKSKHEISSVTESLNYSSWVSRLTSQTSILIRAVDSFFATSSFILRPAPPASAAKSFVKVMVLGLLSVISSRAPAGFFGSGLAYAGGGFLAAAADLGSTTATGSTGFGSSPSI